MHMHGLLQLLIVVVTIAKALSSADSAEEECALYLATSTIPGAGRGVFAGKAFGKDELVDESVSLIILREHAYDNQMTNYVFAAREEEYSMLLFGASSIFNSHANKSVHYVWADSAEQDVSLAGRMPYSNYTRTEFYTKRDIAAGEEMISYYGENWFENRDIPVDADITFEGDLSTVPGRRICLSHVQVRDSPLGGRGLFATRDFAAGELVTVSPVLVLKKALVESTSNTSVLMNYCIADKDVPVVVLPLGDAAVLNHALSPQHNVEMRWFSWESEGIDNVLQKSADELVEGAFAPLDLAFYAVRDIRQDEELLRDYGEDWDTAWNKFHSQRSCSSRDGEYGSDKVSENDSNEVCVSMETANAGFRRFQGTPPLFFPEHWHTPHTPQCDEEQACRAEL